MREVERSAASVEEAIEAALEELGVSEQEAEVDIVQEPQRGLLGLGSREAVVKVRARGEAVDEESLEVQAEVAGEFLAGILERMGVDAEVESHLVDGVMYVDVVAGQDPEDVGRLIGRHGQTLEALQEVVRGAVQRKTGERPLVVVDVEDYRKRRRAQLVERSRDAAEMVKRTGRRHRMEPMNAFERKIVHDAVASVGGVESMSEGEDPQRRVVIQRRGGR